MIARITVVDGTLTEFPLAEKVRGGWQNGATFYPDEKVTEVKELTVHPAAVTDQEARDERPLTPCGNIVCTGCRVCGCPALGIAPQEARDALESIGWSPSAVRRYPEKAFDVMVEFYALSLKSPAPEVTDEMVERQETENRITYSFGATRDRTAHGIRSHADLQRMVEMDTHGPVVVTKREARVITYGSWKPAEAALNPKEER